jgi:hypothetical protein
MAPKLINREICEIREKTRSAFACFVYFAVFLLLCLVLAESDWDFGFRADFSRLLR